LVYVSILKKINKKEKEKRKKENMSRIGD